MKLKQVPFLVRLLKIVALKGEIDGLLTNDLGETMTRFVAKKRRSVRWGCPPGQIDAFHRRFKQLPGSQRGPWGQAHGNHGAWACCYQAWVWLNLTAKQVLKTRDLVPNDLLSHYLKLELANPHLKAI